MSTERPVPYRCGACITEGSYVGRLVWLEQEEGRPVLCRYHSKDGKIAPVEMEPVVAVCIDCRSTAGHNAHLGSTLKPVAGETKTHHLVLSVHDAA